MSIRIWFYWLSSSFQEFGEVWSLISRLLRVKSMGNIYSGLQFWPRLLLFRLYFGCFIFLQQVLFEDYECSMALLFQTFEDYVVADFRTSVQQSLFSPHDWLSVACMDWISIPSATSALRNLVFRRLSTSEIYCPIFRYHRFFRALVTFQHSALHLHSGYYVF